MSGSKARKKCTCIHFRCKCIFLFSDFRIGFYFFFFFDHTYPPISTISAITAMMSGLRMLVLSPVFADVTVLLCVPDVLLLPEEVPPEVLLLPEVLLFPEGASV